MILKQVKLDFSHYILAFHSLGKENAALLHAESHMAKSSRVRTIAPINLNVTIFNKIKCSDKFPMYLVISVCCIKH